MVLYSFYIFDRHSKSAQLLYTVPNVPHAADRTLTSGVHLFAPLDTPSRLLGQVCAPAIRLEHHEQWG